MKELDLVDRINFEQAKENIRSIFESTDDDVKLSICRDLIIDQISASIDKFPAQSQKEILAILTDKYLSQWAT